MFFSVNNVYCCDMQVAPAAVPELKSAKKGTRNITSYRDIWLSDNNYILVHLIDLFPIIPFF
jgi:hypothetical protein